MPIGSLIAVLGEEGEDISGVLADFDAGGDGAAAQTSEKEAETSDETESADEDDASEGRYRSDVG